MGSDRRADPAAGAERLIAMRRGLSIGALLVGLLPGLPGLAAQPLVDIATEVRCDRLLDEAVRLTEEAYRHDGATAERATAEARMMLLDQFFFWPAEYFLLYPSTADAVFMRLRGQMNALWARSDALGCGIAFHPVPES